MDLALPFLAQLIENVVGSVIDFNMPPKCAIRDLSQVALYYRIVSTFVS